MFSMWKTSKGTEFFKDKSKFTAYMAKVTSYQQIRDVYMKLKLLHNTSRHVVCAYWIQGPAYNSRDFHDDGEPGSGRVLLDLLEKNDLINTAVFVIRRYGGVKLGAERFSLYIKAASDVLKLPEAPIKNQRERNAQYQSEETGHLLQESNPDRGSYRGRSATRGRYNSYKRVYHGASSNGRSRDYRGNHYSIRAAKAPNTRGRGRGANGPMNVQRQFDKQKHHLNGHGYAFSPPINKAPEDWTGERDGAFYSAG